MLYSMLPEGAEVVCNEMPITPMKPSVIAERFRGQAVRPFARNVLIEYDDVCEAFARQSSGFGLDAAALAMAHDQAWAGGPAVPHHSATQCPVNRTLLPMAVGGSMSLSGRERALDSEPAAHRR
jgi:hypothetical protein